MWPSRRLRTWPGAHRGVLISDWFVGLTVAVVRPEGHGPAGRPETFATTTTMNGVTRFYDSGGHLTGTVIGSRRR
jgi:hypothetical protein